MARRKQAKLKQTSGGSAATRSATAASAGAAPVTGSRSRSATSAREIWASDMSVVQRPVSGVYQSPRTAPGTTRIELRVDVDGRRPQNQVSGDLFITGSNSGTLAATRTAFPLSDAYSASFVVEAVTAVWTYDKVTLRGPIKYYSDPATTNQTIELEIPRVPVSAAPAPATLRIYRSGVIEVQHVCPKSSEYLRTLSLEIDRFAGTEFPPEISTHVDPHPANLPEETISCAECYRRAGVEMAVRYDDILTDADSADEGTVWSYAELHQLMEDRFDSFADRQQWKVYGVIVPRMGSGATYQRGLYGAMFDWAGWQKDDACLRQGAAIAYDAVMGRWVGTLYNSAPKRARLFLELFVHEIGHTLNLPHSWSRRLHPSTASTSFMNYPWEYAGARGEEGFWSDFRWEFDNVELAWIRHANRADVIFGGNNWIGDNLAQFADPGGLDANPALSLEVRSVPVFDFAEPVQVELKLKNVSRRPIEVPSSLSPEDGLVAIAVRRPDGACFRFPPPVHCDRGPGEPTVLQPGEALYERAALSVSARGPQFSEPGAYAVQASVRVPECGVVTSAPHRLRVAVPTGRDAEELGHLLFDYRAAVVLYLGGSRRHTATISQLEEASRKHAPAYPRVVRHIRAALGESYGRDFKTVTRRRNRYSVAVAKADPEKAVQYLSAALEPVRVAETSPLGNIAYNRLSHALADLLVKTGARSEATRVLAEGMRYLEGQGAPQPVLDSFRKRLPGAGRSASS